MNRTRISLILLIFVVALAACSGGDDKTPEPTTDNNLPESLQNNQSAPPGIGGNNQGFIAATLPPFLSGSPAAALPDSTEVITDFSTLEAGMTVNVSGIFSVVTTESGLQQAILTDANGVSINVIVPPPMLAQTEPSEMELSGALMAPAEAGDPLILNVGPSGLSSFNPGGELPSFITGGQQPPDPNAAQTSQDLPEPPSNFTVGGNLTALQAYDAIVAQAADFLANYQLVTITGANLIGWSIEFRNANDGSSILYTVSPDGTIEALTAVVEGAFNAIDRTQITVDSDSAREQLGLPEGELAILSLSISASGTPQWVVVGGTAEPVSAVQ